MIKGLKKLLGQKCPQCGQHSIFKDPNPFHLKNLVEMHDNCPNCGKDFYIEKGFYWGAMYISYAVNMALFISLIPFYFIFAWGHLIDYAPYFIFTFVPLIILFAPYNLRLSRWIWLWIDFKFFKDKKKG